MNSAIINWLNCKCQKGHSWLESDKNSDPNVKASVWFVLSDHTGWNEIDKAIKQINWNDEMKQDIIIDKSSYQLENIARIMLHWK